MKFLNFLVESESKVKEQLEAIKNGQGEWEKRLKKWILGEESPFTFSGPRNFRVVTPKEVPKEIKKKYPDVIFALQALTKHLASSGYYERWEDAKKYLTFKTIDRPRTFYRYWNIKEEQLKELKSGKPIKVDSKSDVSSYTYNPSLWRSVKDSVSGEKVKLLALETNPILSTKGRCLTLVTKHTFTPIFNLAYFIFHVMNTAKQVFGKTIFDYQGYNKEYGSTGFSTLRRFAHEREVIGPAISEIKPSDVVGYYRMGAFNKLNDKEYEIEVEGIKFIFLPEHINDLKDCYKKNSFIDQTFFDNKIIVTTDPEKSFLKRYAKKGLHYNEKLSKLIGAKVYLGYWQ